MTVSDVVYSPHRWTRTTLLGLDSVHGFSEVPAAGHIEATIRDAPDTLVDSFNEMRCVEVQLSCANGKTIGGANMWCISALEVNASEGTFQVRFEGNVITETLGAAVAA